MRLGLATRSVGKKLYEMNTHFYTIVFNRGGGEGIGEVCPVRCRSDGAAKNNSRRKMLNLRSEADYQEVEADRSPLARYTLLWLCSLE